MWSRSNRFVNVGLHQGSLLSRLLLVLVMDTISEGASKPLPKDLMYAVDSVIVAEGEEELQKGWYNGKIT